MALTFTTFQLTHLHGGATVTAPTIHRFSELSTRCYKKATDFHDRGFNSSKNHAVQSLHVCDYLIEFFTVFLMLKIKECKDIISAIQTFFVAVAGKSLHLFY